jgi:glycosyltransferase involved in cell wall biosynthesis
LLVAGDALPGKYGPNVRSLGYINNLAPLYCCVDFTILPSHYEPFGLVLPESLQCGTPVITTRDVGAAELLSERDGIVMRDNGPETIVQTLSALDRNRFSVEPDFASRHRLRIDQHIEDIRQLVLRGPVTGSVQS